MANSLQSEKVVDDTLHISHFAPLRRAALIASPADVFVRPGKSLPDGDGGGGASEAALKRRSNRPSKYEAKVDPRAAAAKRRAAVALK